MQPSIHTARLLLRPFHMTDALRVQRLAGDAKIADTTTTIPHPYPDGAAEVWIASHPDRFAQGTEVTFAMELRRSKELVGCISLVDICSKHQRAELGYWVGAEHWCKGYCSEAADALVKFGHEELGCTRIVARCFARNGASATVLERSGLVHEGLLPRHILKNGRFEDILLFGLNLPSRLLAKDSAA